MDALPLDVSPVAKFLVDLAERRASGRVAIGGRTLILLGGEVCDVLGADGDPALADFLIAAGRVSRDVLADALAHSDREAMQLDDALLARGHLSRADLRTSTRALWLERFVRGIRSALANDEALPTLENAPHGQPQPGTGLRLLPFALDAFSRLAVDTDASLVGMKITHRLAWTAGSQLDEAKRWAALIETQERPVLSTLLSRSPAAAPQIAALARAGLVRLEPPGGSRVRLPSRTGTLPPPPPRLSVLPPQDEATPEAVERASQRPKSHARPPQLRLDPGADGIPIEAIPHVELVVPPAARTPIDDPLRATEERIAALEARGAPGPERARAFVDLARLWQARLGSLEEAARALREAAAADPADARVLAEAALHCSYLGQHELAVAYADAAVAACPISVERAAAYRMRAEIHRAAGDLAACVEALSEAAAEDGSAPEPHELLALLLSERDNLPLAVAHARLAALGFLDDEPKRAAMLYALAYAWNPIDVGVSEEYAALLERLGHPEAAVAVVAETARSLDDPKTRTRVRLAAAQRAEAIQRRDLSAELLTEIFDEDPAYDLIYAPLDEDLRVDGLHSEHAALLEAIASAASGPDAVRWYVRAGESLLDLPGEREQAAAWLVRARDLAPSDARTLALLQRTGLAPDALASAADVSDARLAQLQSQLAAVASDEEEAQLLVRLCGVHVLRRDPRAVASAALRLLDIDAKQSMALARLWRATAALKDPALIREALTLRARNQPSGRVQGRALARLSRQLEEMNDFEGALAAADAALSSDPSAADAAILILRHAHRLAPQRATALLAQVRPLLSDSPPLLLGLAQAARAAGDFATYEKVLRELANALPSLPDPLLLLLDHELTQDAPDKLLEDADALLRDAGGPQVVALVKDVAARLAELGAHTQAAQLAQRVMDEQGFRDAAYAMSAAQLARDSGDAQLITIALERAAAAADGGDRLTQLLSLADHHLEHGDVVGEVRALLRALAADPTSERAFQGLSQRFTQAGDGPRVLTLLSLRLSTETDPAKRRTTLIEMATAAAHLSHDRERAASYIGVLLGEAGDDREALLHGLGALFALGQAPWAIAEAKRLARALSPEVAGAVYLWVARKAETDLSDRSLALDLAAEGARAFPTVGELLLMVERLALNGRAHAALSLYEDLLQNAIGPHGKRALHYRMGRWLERNGEHAASLEQYTQAFELSVGAGVAFKAIERNARATNHLGPLVNAQAMLASSLRDDDARKDLLLTAARTALDELDDPARAFSLLVKADACAKTSELDEQLIGAARKLATRDTEAAARALSDLASNWEGYAEKLWDADAKVELLHNAARLHLVERHDENACVRVLQAALGAESNASIRPELRAAALTTLATALHARHEESAARQALDQALSLTPALPAALTLQAQWPTVEAIPAAAVAPTPPEPAPPEPSLDAAPTLDAAPNLASAPPTAPMSPVPPPAPPVVLPTPIIELSVAPERSSIPSTKTFEVPQGAIRMSAPPSAATTSVTTSVTPMPAPTASVSKPPPAVSAHPSKPPPRMSIVPEQRPANQETALRQRAATGNVEALTELALMLAADPARRGEGHYLLGQVVSAEPFRIDALRALARESSALGATAQVTVSHEILSLFDRSVSPPHHGTFHHGLVSGREIRSAIDAGRDTASMRLLALAFEPLRSIPRLRRTLESYGLGPTTRASAASDSGAVTAYARAIRLLDRKDVALHLKADVQPALATLPTHPPVVLARTDLIETPALHHRMAQCVVWAEPENAIVCLLPEQDARDVLAAVMGAFGPASRGDTLTRASKELASLLWHTVPMRTQAQMRELADSARQLDYDILRREAMLASHRAGLFVQSDVRLALEAIATLDPALDGIDVSTEAGYRHACERSPAFVDVIRTALSDTYLALTAQVL